MGGQGYFVWNMAVWLLKAKGGESSKAGSAAILTGGWRSASKPPGQGSRRRGVDRAPQPAGHLGVAAVPL